MIEILIFIIGWLVALAVYFFDIRRLYHQEPEIAALLLLPLDMLLHKRGRIVREVAGISLAYTLFYVAGVLQGLDQLFEWAWWTMLCIVGALDLRTTFVPPLWLIYGSTALYLGLSWLTEENGRFVARFTHAAALYAFGTAAALYRQQNEYYTGGGDAPIFLFIGAGLPSSQNVIAFLFFSGAFMILYAIIHALAKILADSEKLIKMFSRAKDFSDVGLGIYVMRLGLSGYYGSPIPLLPPICLAALLSYTVL